MMFHNRHHAGSLLAEKLAPYEENPDTIILGLPRGGIPVAYEVATALRIPLDVFLVRKMGVPYHEELAMGAIASGGTEVLNNEVIGPLHITQDQIDSVRRKEMKELERREFSYRKGKASLDVRGKTAILVDDGLATGSSMLAAVKAVRQLDPKEVVVAVPVAPSSTCARLRREADEAVCLSTPVDFYGVGMWYHDFAQTSDEEVTGLLEKARQQKEAHPRRSPRRPEASL